MDDNATDTCYNKYHNSINIMTFNGYLLRFDCSEVDMCSYDKI